MTLIRVRLCFDRSLSKTLRQCWMLVDTSSCKLVHDLEYLILKKFFRDGHIILNLYLDEFLLPSQEKIEVIRDNDIIRVEEDKNQKSRKFQSSKLTNEGKDKKAMLKRKPEELDDSNRRNKKMKHSPSMNEQGQKNVVLEKQLKHLKRPEFAVTKTSINIVKSKTKCQKAADLLNQISKENANFRKASGDKITDDRSAQRKTKQTKSIKDKSKSNPLECVLVNHNSKRGNKQGNLPLVEEVSKHGLMSSKPSKLESGNIRNKKISKGVHVIDRGHECEGTTSKNKQEKKTVDQNKKTSAVLCSKEPSTSSSTTSTTSSSSLSSSSSDDECNAGIVQKNKFNRLTGNKVNKPGKGLKPSIASQDKNVMPKRNQQLDSYLSKQSNHIRFDNDSGDENIATNVELIPCPSASAITNTRDIDRTPKLSPIQSNIENATAAQNIHSGHPVKEMIKKGRQRVDDLLKDIYTNKSVVMESTRVEKGPQEPCLTPDHRSERDFSKYQLLRGPPRVGETVAYKVLELSQSYTPEISQYKEGKVLEFDPVTNQLKLKLTKESLSRSKGDGHISFKFELFDNEEENEDKESTLPVELPDEVEVQWSSMIEPRLVLGPGIV